MTTRAVAEMDDWESSPFSGGYAGLRDLVDDEFSGIVQSGAAKLCLLNGTAVGVLDGSIEDFDGASGTAYEPPSPALPLLAMMQDRSDEVRAKYYTEETPVSEVNRTLSDGGFSGFVELSENVLSGDYYVVYHAGRSMAVAWVGNSKQLLTDDEAFDRADDEVGIYEVRQVDIEPVEIPDPAGGAAAGAASGSNGDRAAGRASGTGTGDAAADASESARETSGAGDRTGATETTEATTADAAGATGAETAPDRSTRSEDVSSEQSSDAGSEGTGDRRASEPDTGSAEGRSEGETTARESAGTGQTERRERAGDASTGASDATDAVEGGGIGRDAGGVTTPAERLETRSIPSLDPGKTSEPEGSAVGGAATAVESRSDSGEESATPDPDPASNAAGASGAEPAESASHREQPAETPSEPATEPAGSSGADTGGPRARSDETTTRSAEEAQPADRGSGASERVADLEAEIEDLESELVSVEGEREDLRRERDELREERDALRAERDELAAEVEQLEAETERLRSQLDELEAEFGGGADGGRRLSPTEALDGTNLFVRYGSKGKATLESAHGGNATREEVSQNLDLELHTQFDADSATVGGQPFDEYLRGTLQHRFVTWVVNDLIYEIRETGKVAALQDLYDAIPDIDRAELAGAITVEFTEDGQQRTSEESFDIVLRDRMGNPLVVANLNDSREAATESMMNSLVSATSRVSESNGSLAAAVFVTSSFFEPEALETAADATSGSLLSRDKRESFVKLSRKRGYHLCLAEAREEQFHLAVPEL
jgi:cell division protein FtsB